MASLYTSNPVGVSHALCITELRASRVSEVPVA